MANMLHRYKIWQLGGNAPGEAPPRSDAGTTRQVEDLVALMALYDYRPFIDVELRGTVAINGNAAKCKATSISPDVVNLVFDTTTGAAAPKKGGKVHLNLDKIGPFHGTVASQKAEALRVDVDRDCKPMLKSKLSRMVAEHAVDVHEGRQPVGAMKIEPAIKACNFIDHTGTMRRGVVVNVSQTDALIKARIIPPVASRITFRGSIRRLADVTRIFEMGFTARFCNLIPAEELTSDLKLTDE